MTPRSISLCQLSFPDTILSEDIEIANGLGVAGISLAESKISPQAQAAHRQELEDAGVQIPFGVPSTWTILPPLGGTFPADPEDPTERIMAISHGIHTLADFGAPSVMVCTGPAGDRSEREARAVVIDGLRSLAKEARDAGSTLSIEPMRESYRPIRTMISTLGETFDLLEQVGDNSVGIVLDLWHLWDCPDLTEHLTEALSRTHAVQIADYRDPTRGPLDRVAAGDGIADLPRLLALVRSEGYDGWYDLEVFSDDGRFGSDYEDSLWNLPSEDFARVQVEGFLDCWRLSESR